MKKLFRVVSAGLFLSCLAYWLASGRNTGWTKTSQPHRAFDAVTGIEGITYQPCFLPGVDFLAAALFLSFLVFGVSFFLPGQTRKNC